MMLCDEVDACEHVVSINPADPGPSIFCLHPSVDQGHNMATLSLKDVLAFSTDAGESALPPECALIVLTSTLATPSSFIIHYFLQELLSSATQEGAVFMSFLNGGSRLAPSMKKLVTIQHINLV